MVPEALYCAFNSVIVHVTLATCARMRSSSVILQTLKTMSTNSETKPFYWQLEILYKNISIIAKR